jgi:hypothetical protein
MFSSCPDRRCPPPGIPRHDLSPIVTLQHAIYLAAADSVPDYFFVTLLLLGSIQQLSFFRLLHERLQQSLFFLKAHVAAIPTVMIPNNRFYSTMDKL